MRVQQSIDSFKQRMKITFDWSIKPFSFLYSLFSQDSQGDYGPPISIVSKFIGLISSPVLILAGLISIILGSIGALLQALAFPFELLVSKIRDNHEGNQLYLRKKGEGDLGDARDPGPKNNFMKDNRPAHHARLFENRLEEEVEILPLGKLNP